MTNCEIVNSDSCVQHLRNETETKLIGMTSLIPGKTHGIKIRGRLFNKASSLLLDTDAVVSLINHFLVPDEDKCKMKPTVTRCDWNN